jgi:hypothetical protein
MDLSRLCPWALLDHFAKIKHARQACVMYLSVCMVIYSTGNSMIGFAVALLLTTVFTFLTGWMAGRRGRSTKLWYWLGAILGPIALLVIALLPPVLTTPAGQTR